MRKTKRQRIRDERRVKKRAREFANAEANANNRSAKRQKRDDPDGNHHHDADDGDDGRRRDDNNEWHEDGNGAEAYDDDEYGSEERGPARRLVWGTGGVSGFLGPERGFFGMLTDQEQEYFRRADELLELNEFPSAEERHLFLQSVYREARGKELRLASSQSCSRLMERLIILSSTRQKKRLFLAFAGNFPSLIIHRFASHCCEKLLLLSAPLVTRELTGEVEREWDEGDDDDINQDPAGRNTSRYGGAQDGGEKEAPKSLPSMEELFLFTLDELEEHLSYLLSDTWGSHAIRALLIILSGRPLDQASTKSLLQSKKKEHVTVEGASARPTDMGSETRAVPPSFTVAVRKIISDSTSKMDATALRILAKHPTGNPTLQLLLELDMAMTPKTKDDVRDASKEPAKSKAHADDTSLLERLIPRVPASFREPGSQACEFVNSMMYDPIGSRLLETLITHAPGKIFKGLQQNLFGPRIASLLRNDVASYPAIRVLDRLSRDDLVEAVKCTLPQIPSLLEKGRLNVIKTLFERCSVREATDEIDQLLAALVSACGGDAKNLVPRLCLLDQEESVPEAAQPKHPSEAKTKTALISHGSQVATTLLAMPAPASPSKAIQTSLVALTAPQTLRLAASSAATSRIIIQALSPATPARTPHFHKVLTASLLPHVMALAESHHGQAVLNTILTAPSKSGVSAGGVGGGHDNKKNTSNISNKNNNNPITSAVVVPFHLKEAAMATLADNEAALRESWLGRQLWRAWKGDVWAHRRHDWVRWAKEAGGEAGGGSAGMPTPRRKGGFGHGGRTEGGSNPVGGKGKRKTSFVSRAKANAKTAISAA